MTTRRAMLVGLAATAGSLSLPARAIAAPSGAVEIATEAFHRAADRYLEVRYVTFYAGSAERRVFGPSEWRALEPWDRAIGDLRRAADAVFTNPANAAVDIALKLKVEVAERMFGLSPLPDLEWASADALRWLGALSAEVEGFGLAINPAWMRRIEAFHNLPDDAFYAALGRSIGRA